MPIRERSGTWYYRFWVNGQEYTASTDLAATERNRTAAVRVEAKARELVLKGKAHELKLEVHPFNDAVTEFLDWADGQYREHPNSAKRLRTSFASLTTFFGKLPVSSILKGNVRQYMAWRRKEHKVKEITLRHDLHALSKAFQFWIDLNYARENSVAGVEIPSDTDAVRMHVLTAAEEMAYFAAARRFPNLYDLCRVMLNQGCRPEEVLGLQKSNVNLEAGSFTIAKGKSAAARRTLRMSAETRSIMATRLGSDGPWIFPSPRLPGLPVTKLNNSHSKALKASATSFVIYDLRHTFATRAAEGGMPIATLAAILGHKDLRSITKYVHVRQDAQNAAMARYEQQTTQDKDRTVCKERLT